MKFQDEIVTEGNVAHVQRLDEWWLSWPFNACPFNADVPREMPGLDEICKQSLI
jgi:hypothetical protein